MRRPLPFLLALISFLAVLAWLVNNAGPEDVPEDGLSLPPTPIEADSAQSSRLTLRVPEAEREGVAAAIEEAQSKSPLRMFGGEYEDPQFGIFHSQEEVNEDIIWKCGAFMSPDWVEEQIKWIVNGKAQEEIPYGILSPNRSVSDFEREAIATVVDRYNVEIHFLAQEAMALFDLYRTDYTLGLKRIPYDAVVVRTPKRQKLANKGFYQSYSVLRVGLDKYVIDFISMDYPDMEAKFIQVDEMRHQREVAALAVLGL